MTKPAPIDRPASGISLCSVRTISRRGDNRLAAMREMQLRRVPSHTPDSLEAQIHLVALLSASAPNAHALHSNNRAHTKTTIASPPTAVRFPMPWRPLQNQAPREDYNALALKHSAKPVDRFHANTFRLFLQAQDKTGDDDHAHDQSHLTQST